MRNKPKTDKDGLKPKMAVCMKCPYCGIWSMSWVPAEAHICRLPVNDESIGVFGTILDARFTGPCNPGYQLPVIGSVPIKCLYILEHLVS